MSSQEHNDFPATPQAHPLMQPVTYNGETRYTTQYFHAQYLHAHSDAPKKYQRHHDFLRMLRSLPLYADYVGLGHIAEIPYDKNRQDSLKQILLQLYKATGYQPIVLLNATAQSELSHHLEDAMSKQLAHAANTVMATSASHQPDLLREAKADLQTWLEIAEIFEAPRYIALIEGTKDIQKRLGIDLSPVLQLSAALDAIPDEQVMLEPTEIGKRLGISGAELNRRLAHAGLQTRVGTEWVATDAGTEHAYRHAWHKDGKSGFNLKWHVEFVLKALAAQGAP